MKKVIRLNEQDIEKLVKKIIKEGKTSINEGPLGWLRKKFNSDEEIGLSILKGIKLGEASALNKTNPRYGGDIYRFLLGGHNIEVSLHLGFRSGTYTIKVDDEELEVSDNTIKQIMKIAYTITDQPRKNKIKDIKTSMSRYSLPDEERNRLENPETYFGELN